MARIDLPKGLIAYDNDANVKLRQQGHKARYHFVRPRTVLYTVVLAIVSAIMLLGLSTRHTLEMDVLRDRNPNYVTLADGAVRNAYTLKLMNRFDEPRELLLSISGIKARSVNVIGLGNIEPPVRLHVEADKVRTVRVLVTVGKANIKAGEQRLSFSLHDAAKQESREVSTVFVAGDGK